MTEIEVRRDLKLVQLSEKHARELFEVTDQNRAHLREWLPWLDNTTKREDTVLFIRGTKNMSGLNFAIFFEGKIVCCVGHNQYSPANKTASLGYWLSRDAGGKGIMSDS
ncbi:MAG: GNAT family N-acetyltransferase, partial [Halobacteriovoraceae bacterium]|nr:GNAT family N-acetyltransferase [Halobacteriovoraceae bacterium]